MDHGILGSLFELRGQVEYRVWTKSQKTYVRDFEKESDARCTKKLATLSVSNYVPNISR